MTKELRRPKGPIRIAALACNSCGRRLSAAIIVLLIFRVIAAQADNWPQFRGPTGLGYAHERNLPLTWNGKTGENIVWKTPLPKADNPYSSPIVWGERVFLIYALNQS